MVALRRAPVTATVPAARLGPTRAVLTGAPRPPEARKYGLSSWLAVDNVESTSERHRGYGIRRRDGGQDGNPSGRLPLRAPECDGDHTGTGQGGAALARRHLYSGRVRIEESAAGTGGQLTRPRRKP
ncbi:hypothetical protein GCM10027258_55290 [Amycolatopsis stemonae]